MVTVSLDTPGADLFLRCVSARSSLAAQRGFPFELELLRDFEEVRFEAPVTLLVGENGCGKSTWLEALATLLRCVAMGGEPLERDPTLCEARRLADHLLAVRGEKLPRSRVFFRAEDAFGFTQRIEREQRELDELERSFEGEFADGSWGQKLAMGTARGQREALRQRYGVNPNARSHGESFLHLLDVRTAAGGLFLLDEPETPLSPVSVLALIRLVMERVERGSQFVIATHSPMLMALPGAVILQLGEEGFREVKWSELDHVTVMRGFLNDPQSYLRRL